MRRVSLVAAGSSTSQASVETPSDVLARHAQPSAAAARGKPERHVGTVFRSCAQPRAMSRPTAKAISDGATTPSQGDGLGLEEVPTRSALPPSPATMAFLC